MLIITFNKILVFGTIAYILVIHGKDINQK